jgi:hypothetical protein
MIIKGKEWCPRCESLGVFCKMDKGKVLGVIPVYLGRVKYWEGREFRVGGRIEDCPVVKDGVTVASMFDRFQKSIPR